MPPVWGALYTGMTDKSILRLDYCDHAAAAYAVKHWHYSHAMPAGKTINIGVWESGDFKGVIIFSRGSNNNIGKPYKLQQTEVCEMTRIALTNHQTAVSRIITIAIKLLTKASPGLRLITNYADPDFGHTGAIYQAAGCVFIGMSHASDEYIVNGERHHGRSIRSSKPKHLTTKEYLAILDPNYQITVGSSKYSYLYPLDAAMKAQIAPLAKPYPKRVPSVDSGTIGDQPISGGAIPTGTLAEMTAPND